MKISFLVLVNNIFNHWNLCPLRKVHLGKLKEFVPILFAAFNYK